MSQYCPTMFRHLAIMGCLILPTFAAEPLIKKGQGGWKAWDQKEAPAEGWADKEYDTNGWKEASTPLGYGKEPVTTTLSFGEDGQKKHPTVYVRHTFKIEEVAAAYLIKVRLDDGAVFCVNGKEVHRLNVAKATKLGEYSKFALGPGVVESEATLVLEPEVVNVGENVLAVALFQSGPTSSDLFLNLELTPMDKEALEKMKKEAAERKQKREEAEKKAAKEKSAPTA